MGFLGTDAEGHVTTTRYWPDNQVWKVIDAQGNHAVVQRYYSDGSLKEVNDAKGHLTQYEYNGFQGLQKTTYPNNTYEEPTYDDYRRVIQMRGRSGQLIQFAYDNLSRVVTKTLKHFAWGSWVIDNTITYEYDLLGRLYQTTDNSGTTQNTYDKAGRLMTSNSGDTILNSSHPRATCGPADLLGAWRAVQRNDRGRDRTP